MSAAVKQDALCPQCGHVQPVAYNSDGKPVGGQVCARCKAAVNTLWPRAPRPSGLQVSRAYAVCPLCSRPGYVDLGRDRRPVRGQRCQRCNGVMDAAVVVVAHIERDEHGSARAMIFEVIS